MILVGDQELVVVGEQVHDRARALRPAVLAGASQ